MTTYVFHGERVRLPTRFTCSCCGKTGRTRTITVEHTVNPFNKNADGTVKSRSEVRADARAEAVLRRAKFLTEPWCKSCEDDLSYSDGKALRERRNANHQNTVSDPLPAGNMETVK